jgi:polysaccharide pyruvyl transferase WcaK-like protein
MLVLASPLERPLRQQRSVRLLLVGARLHSAVAAAAAAPALEEAVVDLEA